MHDFKRDMRTAALTTYCAGLAYGDMRRTLRFNGGAGDKERKGFREGMFHSVVDWIHADLFTLENPRTQFDAAHKSVCEEIIDAAKGSGLFADFTVGQAQKWLNMTLKNILLLNLCPDEMTDALIASLHAPVDSVIIKRAWDLGGVAFPFRQGAKPTLGNVVKWSKWDNWDDYQRFQDTLRDSVKLYKSGVYKSRIEWEFYKWRE